MLRRKRFAALIAVLILGALAVGCDLLNRDPIASFTLTPTSGPAPLAVQVDGSSSVDPDGDALTYAWDFGDGATAGGAAATHVYATAGTYLITLVVSDSTGRESTTSRTVLVSTSGAAPIASFIASPSSGGTPLTVEFNAAGSHDPDGTIVSYVWNFGDGATATGGAPLHTYTAQGAYSAALTVTDNDGMTDTSTLAIVVIDSGQGGVGRP